MPNLYPYMVRARAIALEYRRLWPLAGGIALLLLIYAFAKAGDGNKWVVIERNPNFSDAKLLNIPLDSLYSGKETLLDRKTSEVARSQRDVEHRLDQMDQKIAALQEPRTPAPPLTPTPEPIVSSTPIPLSENAPSQPNPAPIPNSSPAHVYRSRSRILGTPGHEGPDLISFPVKVAKTHKDLTVAIPPGSYVRGKLLTGVEAPEGKTYPVLLELDYAHILPNHQRLDLSGCFMIVKATGNLSIERVEMQATKLSCVAQNGEMFERDVNGFIADDKDNSFALIGSVNTKQNRVATMAFLASVVDGVGRAIQQAQTTQQTTALGGSQSVLTGDQMKFIGAGGAATAANMVAQWYLKQAQNLLPTINVGSGREVWVVMQETVHLPTSYFQKNTKGETSENLYSYFTRVLQ